MKSAVQVTGLTDLSRSLKAAADGSSKRLRTGLKSAGQIVQRQAQKNSRWSRKIPNKIKVSVTNTAIAVYVKDPEAVIFEVGGRHPLFGDRRHWYTQEPRPYLQLAATQTVDDVASAVLEAVASITL